MDIRFFAGTFLSNNLPGSGSNLFDARFRTSGQTGYQDYMYDNVFLGRSETQGLWSQQFTETDGGFKIFSPLGQTSKWLTTLNIKSSLPGIIPIRVFADIGTCASDGIVNQNFLFDAGLNLSIIRNVFEIYFPLAMSKDIQNYVTANNIKYLETVRFTLNFNIMNPFGLIKNFSL